MKLLLDENLTFRLTKYFVAEYPGSCHVNDVNLAQTDDMLVWQWAQGNGFAIVTQDADFEQLAVLRGQPPKVIYLRFGNSSLLGLISQLQHCQEAIAQFLGDPKAACLTLNHTTLRNLSAE